MSAGLGLSLIGQFRMPDGRRWADCAAQFQRETAAALFDPAAPPFIFRTSARGTSKTMDAAAIGLVWLPSHPGTRSYVLAADRDQGQLVVDSIAGFVERTPGLRDQFEVQTWRVIHRKTGSALTVLAADGAGVWGLRPSLAIVDEIAQWPTTAAARRLFEGVLTAMPKLRGSKLLILSTAGEPSHWSKRILDAARDDPAWATHEVEGAAPWMSEESLAAQRRALPESSFRRLFLNQWVEAEDRLARDEDIAAAALLGGPLDAVANRSYVIGVDVGIRNDRTVAAACHVEQVEVTEGPRVVLDRMEVWSGSREQQVQLGVVEEWIADASRRYNRAKVILDPWQSIGMSQRLRARGITVTEFNFSSQSVGRLASTLHLLLRDRRLSLPDDEDLLGELRRVRLRETTPGVLRMDHDAGQHDDRAIALALAAQHLLDRRPSGVSRLGRDGPGLLVATNASLMRHPDSQLVDASDEGW